MTTTSNNTTPLINPNGKPIRIGCVGGGQLGRMMALESPRLNISMSFLDPLGEDCPAAQASGCQSQSTIVKGKLDDEEKLMELAKNGGDGGVVDLVTVEIEHVGVEGLRKLEEQGVSVQPGSRVIGLIQDKFAQKEHFRKSSIPVPSYQQIKSVKCIHEAASELGLPLMLKSRRGAYDGRGNAVLKSISNDDITAALSSLGASSESVELDLYAEGWIDFECELAVMVVRSITGETRAYPTVNAIQLDSICRVVLAPAREISGEIRHKCEAVAQRAIDSLGKGATGVFGVELFLCKSGEVLLNEVAPRPHNTGHYTQDACGVSQFENHLRAISGLPLGDTGMSVGAAAMVNVLGARSGEMSDTIKSSTAALSIPRATVHWYGKAACRAGRKMGHINVTADSPAELDSALREILQLEAVDYEQVVPRSSSSSRRPLTTTTPPPLVGVIMGSSSDLPCMQAAVEMLHKFQIPCEVDIVSAHRTPEKLMSYSRNAARRGIACIIAGAGGAAHLPGMVAAMTPLPVIGVPIKTSTLNGQDSLLSIVQMPRGVPVATVAIGNATNAGLLAVRILAASRIDLREKMEEYQDEMRQTVENTSDQLLDQGSTVFLEGMDNKNMSVNV